MHPRLPALLAALLASAVLTAHAAHALPTAGWLQVSIPATGSYYWRYLPASAASSSPLPPLPVILFLHGAGGSPELYREFVRDAAESAKAVIVLPKSASDQGWDLGGSDDLTVSETLRLLRLELPVDGDRVAIAGHSAGGAYAYLLAYTTPSRYSAVFTLGASFYSVDHLADPGYTAPIRMYYGTTDLNYATGPYTALKAQWDRLHVPWEEDIQPGFGHNTWPVQSMTDGFRFLVGKTYVAAPPPPPPPIPTCEPGATAFCLLGGRFRAEVTWTTAADSGFGQTVACANDGSGLFWFFAPDNWELMLKVIDGCLLNDRFWVFSAATTNVGYELTVTDTWTGKTAVYRNPLGTTAPATTDTQAFTCP